MHLEACMCERLRRVAYVVVVVVVVAWSHAAGAQVVSPGPERASGVQSAQPEPGAAEVRISDVRQISRRKGGRTRTQTVDLVIDRAGGTLRLERRGAATAVIALGDIIAVHFETETGRRILGRSVTPFVVIHHTQRGDGTGTTSLRLRQDDLEAARQGLADALGSRVGRTGPRRSFLGLPLRIAVGDTVRVTTLQGSTTKGRITGLSPSSLDMTTAAGVQARFDATAIDGIETPFAAGRAARIGFGSGFVTGLFLGAGLCSGFGGCSAGDVPALLGFGAYIGGLSAGASLAFGALMHPLDPNRIILFGTGEGAPLVPSVGILAEPGRRGVRLSWAF